MSASISKKRKSTLRARQATLRAASNAFDSNARRARSATSRAGAPQGERDRSRAARAVMRPRAALRRNSHNMTWHRYQVGERDGLRAGSHSF